MIKSALIAVLGLTLCQIGFAQYPPANNNNNLGGQVAGLREDVRILVERVGPKGLEYGRFSIDSHFTRNALWVQRHHPEKAEAHIPAFARRIISRYRLPAP